MLDRELFDKLFPTKGLSPGKYNLVRERDALIAALNEFLPKYEINTKRRVDAALSCWGYETDYFRTTEEYASGSEYEGHKDLGNTQKGDGKRYKGRGVTQTTGRYNYEQLTKAIGGKLGIDFLANPEKLNDVRIAVESACIFWQAHNLNQYADQKQIKYLNGLVNRGSITKTPLGWANRNELYSKCFRYTPAEPFPVEEITPEPTPQPIDDQKIEFAQMTLQRPSVKQVAVKAGWRMAGGLASVWGTTGGKVAVVGTFIVVSGVISYVAYHYRKQIQLGWQIAVLTLKKKVGLS